MLPQNPNAFAPEPLDRAGKKRSDAAWLASVLADPNTRVLPFHQRKVLARNEGEALAPVWLAPPLEGEPSVFLGLDSEARAYFAFETDKPEDFAPLGEFADLQRTAMRFADDQLAIIGTAKALFEWHARHRFCSNCGALTRIVEAGWRRDCDACKAQHFPRVDPVVIMVPTYKDRCLIARGPHFPPNMRSALAGFVEPGETIASAIAREVMEEVGLKVVSIRMHSTQPWPYPSSLMIGALCEVENDKITLDLDEIAEADWCARAEVTNLLASFHPDPFVPPSHAIAHQLLKSWVAQDDTFAM
jgi:NAD+ diphosphatase